MATQPLTREVVVAVDGSPASAAALRWGAAYARSTGRRLRALHVVHPGAGQRTVWTTGLTPTAYAVDIGSDHTAEKAVHAVFESVSPEPDWVLDIREGAVGSALVDASANADLLVVGTRDQAGFDRLVYGSVSHYCLNRARCPVVAVATRMAPEAETADTSIGTAAPAEPATARSS